jgi:hypothetical protein
MEQVKPFHVPQERQNAIVFYINGKGHISSISVKRGEGKAARCFTQGGDVYFADLAALLELRLKARVT